MLNRILSALPSLCIAGVLMLFVAACAGDPEQVSVTHAHDGEEAHTHGPGTHTHDADTAGTYVDTTGVFFEEEAHEHGPETHTHDAATPGHQ